MKLQEYLEGVRNCPDKTWQEEDGNEFSALDWEFGIHDNFSLLMKGDYADVINDLAASPNVFFSGSYRPSNTRWGNHQPALERFRKNGITGRMRIDFDYVPGTVLFQVKNEPDAVGNFGPEVIEQLHKMYNLSFIVHPYQDDNLIPGVHRHRIMAQVIADICNYGVKKDISFCMPSAIGLKHLWHYGGTDNPNDPKKIVFYPRVPAGLEYMFGTR